MRFRGQEWTGAGVKVAIVDSGVDAMDPRLAGVSVSGWNIKLNATGHAMIGPDWADLNGHGTDVAASVLAVAPDVEIVSVRIMDGALRTTADLMAAGIETAFRNGARIINLSMGTPNMGKALLLRDTIALARESGAVVLAAAHPRGERAYPADLPETLGVASHPDCGHGRMFYFDPRRFGGAEWGTLTDKFLARGYLERAGSAADYIGSEIATAHVAGVVACLAQAMSGSSPERLIDALKGRSLRPMPELGYA
ncbi:MAG: S8 family serine peptidase [Myxococcota bacterium]|nr:S8 family serine peptidase [Myxococcota bacterium]